MAKRKALWWEFLVPVRGGNDRTICGLCANHGIVRLGRDKTPSGFELEQHDAPCICPNGRAKAKSMRRPKR